MPKIYFVGPDFFGDFLFGDFVRSAYVNDRVNRSFQRDENDIRREHKAAKRNERLHPDPVVIDAEFVDLVDESKRLK